MEEIYLFVPLVAYLVAGSIKFLINSIKEKSLAFKLIGLGGMPSTHNTICSSVFFVVGFSEGFNSPLIAVCGALCMIVAIDSMDLRKKIEAHAVFISSHFSKIHTEAAEMRVRLSHTFSEVACGWLIGFFIGYSFS